MNHFIIVSYATKDTPYEQILREYLLKSLENIKIDSNINIVTNLGDWTKNTGYKPKFILDRINHYQNDYDSVVFVDSDATIEQYPKLFEDIPSEYDIGVHYLDHNSWYQNGSGKKELLSGTMFLRCNEKVKKLCEDWYNISKETNEWEQKVLEQLLKKNKDIKVYQLPLEYCYIETLPNGLKPFIKVENPIIVHHQVSRQTKKWFKYQKYNIPMKGIK